MDEATATLEQDNDTEKSEPVQQEVQDCEETNNISNKKDVENVDEESSKNVGNSSGIQSTLGMQKFFYFYQGTYLIIYLCSFHSEFITK